MSIERAAALLTSTDTTENINGIALVINSAATAQNIPGLLSANIVALLLPKLNSSNEELVMKAAWAVNNLCTHEKGLQAVYAAKVLDYFPNLLKNRNHEVIKKTCWALTNLAREPRATKDIVSGPIFPALVRCLDIGSSDEERGAALQPLCNLVLNAENQLAFQRANGIPSVVRLLSSSHDRTKELALTLVSFVTTNHDSIREALINNNCLAPLCDVINGNGTPKMQELAINSLVNLSLAEKAEQAILDQNSVKPVVGLLSSDVPKLQQQAAMLLSNLLTNKLIREHIRYLGWVDPVINILKTGDAASLQQILRVIINITFDAHCRHLLASSDAEKHVSNASKRVPDATVSSLSTTALKNLTVPAPADVINEVENAKRGGRIQGVAVPKANKREAKTDDLEGFDDLIGDLAGGGKRPTPSVSAKPSSPPPTRGAANDDLDGLLDELNTPSKPVSKPSNAPKPTVTPTSKPAPAPAPKPVPAKSAPKNDLGDLDDLLAEVSAPPKPQPQSSSGLSDIDDLLADIDTSSKKTVTTTAKATPAKSNPPPAAKPVSKPAPKPVDDIDDLLADIGPSPSKSNPPASKPAPKNDLEDIDDLLNGMNFDSNKGGSRPQSTYGGGTDDIDDLLSGLESGNDNKSGNDAGMDAIDDLLADLTG